jgi:hypothetical protein
LRACLVVFASIMLCLTLSGSAEAQGTSDAGTALPAPEPPVPPATEPAPAPSVATPAAGVPAPSEPEQGAPPSGAASAAESRNDPGPSSARHQTMDQVADSSEQELHFGHVKARYSLNYFGDVSFALRSPDGGDR